MPLRSNHLLVVPALCLGLAAAVPAGSVTSSNFAFTYDCTANSVWSGIPVLPTTQGDFTFAPAVAGNTKFSEWGPSFADGILVNGTQGGTTGNSGRSSDFAVAIDAAYSGAGTVAEITLEITEIRIYAASYTTLQGDNQLQWVETTPGVTASSPEFDLTVCGSFTALTQAANYTDVTWDPPDTAVAAAAATTRTFALAADNNRALEGLEVTGVVKVRLDGSEDPITSGEFSFGYNYTADRIWSALGATLPPTAQGDFTFTPTVSANPRFSEYGPVVAGRVLTNGVQGSSSGRSSDFSVSIEAGYTGAAPATEITIEITGIRIYGASYTTAQGDNQLQWVETTPGVTARSPEFILNVCGNLTALTQAANYTDVTWDPPDFAMAGPAATRSFALDADNNRAIDGLEIFGRVTVTDREFELKVARNDASLDFEWTSRVGRQYDLLSATSLDTPPETWPVYQNHQAIPASGTGANTLPGVAPDGARRFFLVAERDAPPTPAELELLRLQKISTSTQHCAFTGLTRFNDQFYCTWREASSHVSADGKLRVVRSADGINWTSVALIAGAGTDLRDSKIEVTPDNRLILHACEKFPDGTSPLRRNLAWFSTDGTTWSDPVYIAEDDIWFWKHTWHQDTGYGVGYATASPYFARLYTSTDATSWTTHVATLNNNGYVNESSIVFMPDATAHCLLRRDSGTNTALLGTAPPPYTNWIWQDLGIRIGGPEMIRMPDDRLLAAVRLYSGSGWTPARTSLCWIDPQAGTLTEALTFPSGGDTSYAGMVWHDNRLWVSYYSSHEGPTCVYFAEVAYNPPAG